MLTEGIRAIAFIPIVQDDRLLGKFMTYYDRPHVFAPAEIELAVTLARQLGLAVERKRAERAAQHFVAIVESSHDAIISKDLNGIITSWNEGAERLFGYTADEAIGNPITMLIPPDRLDEEPGILARIRRGERVDHFETIRRRKDGSIEMALIKGSRVSSGGITITTNDPELGISASFRAPDEISGLYTAVHDSQVEITGASGVLYIDGARATQWKAGTHRWQMTSGDAIPQPSAALASRARRANRTRRIR